MKQFTGIILKGSSPLSGQTRYMHSALRRASSSVARSSATSERDAVTMPLKFPAAKTSCLAALPTSCIIRSYLITRATSSPIMLRASFAIIKRMLDPKARLMSTEHNPLLKALFKHTFYAQFCAGENKAEVQKTILGVKQVGYTGVILEYALELLNEESGAAPSTAEEIEVFRKGMLETVDMASPGDFVALKWSGIGREALELLNQGKPPTAAIEGAIREVCDLAAKKDVAVLPGAELEMTNAGIDDWTLKLQGIYNKDKPGKALMYTTYQAYLRSTPSRIARDLAVAQRQGFTLGVKLVRGAYMLSEPKTAVVESKEATDKAYDKITEAILKREYNDVLKPHDGAPFPNVALMMATHNAQSVKHARSIRKKQAQSSEARVDLAYAQLQGMADEISCELVAASKSLPANDPTVDVPRPFKCATWGTVEHCLNFLYRRALENQDAASRTEETRKAMGRELWCRTKAAVGLK